MGKLRQFFRGMEYDEHGKIIPVDKMSEEGQAAVNLRLKVLGWLFVGLALHVVAFLGNRMLGALM